MKKWTVDCAALLLRITTGLIFIPHGWSKVMGASGVGAFASNLPSYGIPTFLGYIAAYAELFGGVLLIVGLLTRVDAFLLACTMFVATFVVQLPDALHDPEAGNKFFAAMHAVELPLSLFAITIALVLMGGGRWSLDGLIASRRSRVAGRTDLPPATSDQPTELPRR